MKLVDKHCSSVGSERGAGSSEEALCGFSHVGMSLKSMTAAWGSLVRPLMAETPLCFSARRKMFNQPKVESVHSAEQRTFWSEASPAWSALQTVCSESCESLVATASSGEITPASVLHWTDETDDGSRSRGEKKFNTRVWILHLCNLNLSPSSHSKHAWFSGGNCANAPLT